MKETTFLTTVFVMCLLVTAGVMIAVFNGGSSEQTENWTDEKICISDVRVQNNSELNRYAYVTPDHDGTIRIVSGTTAVGLVCINGGELNEDHELMVKAGHTYKICWTSKVPGYSDDRMYYILHHKI